MKKMIALLAVLFMVMVVGNAAALPTANGDLDVYFQSKGWDIDVEDYLNPTLDGFSLTTGSTATHMSFYLEGTDDDYPNGIGFGIYSLAGDEDVDVFSPDNTPLATSSVEFFDGNLVVTYLTRDGGLPVTTVPGDSYDFTGQTFGFYAFGSNNIIYSDSDENDGNYIGSMLTYNIAPGAYVFAVDFDGNGTFTDAIMHAESIAPVPEPATMLLFGTGLAGLGVFGRKKKK